MGMWWAGRGGGWEVVMGECWSTFRGYPDWQRRYLSWSEPFGEIVGKFSEYCMDSDLITDQRQMKETKVVWYHQPSYSINE